VPALSATPALPLRSRLLRTVLGALTFLVPGLFLTGEVRAIFVGGFLVMQLVSLVTTISSLQITRALLAPGALRGQLSVPRATQTRLTAATLLSFALFSFGVSALTGSPSFFSAGLFLAATAWGYGRRAAQYAAQDRAAEAAVPPANFRADGANSRVLGFLSMSGPGGRGVALAAP